MSIGSRLTTIAVLAAACCAGGWGASAGWPPPRQLAFSPLPQERLAAPAVYAEGDHVMVVYLKRELWFIESTDAGRSWSEPVAISRGVVLNRNGLDGSDNLDGVSRDLRPAIIADRSHLLVVWHGFEQGNYRIFLAKRRKGTESWDSPVALVSPGRDSHAFNPRFVLTSQGLFLFWYNVIRAPGALGAITPTLSTDVLRVRGAEGPASINLDVDFRGVGMDTRQNSIAVQFGMINVSYQIQPEMVRTPSPLQTPAVFAAFTDQFGNLYCSMTENLQILTRKYNPTLKNWSATYDFRFDPKYFMSAHYLSGRLQVVRVENRPDKVVVELLPGPAAAPIRTTDPVDLDSIPSFWADGDLTHVVWGRFEGDSSWIAYARSDHVPPSSRFVAPEAREVAQISESPFLIAWEGRDNYSPPDGLLFRYRFTGGGWSEWRRVSGIRILAPPDRPTPYEVEVQAMDEAGNVQPTPASLKFDVSGVAPNTLITEGRQEVVVRRQHTFAFLGQDNTDGPTALKYSYRLNDEPDSEFKEQTRVTLENLREGSHTFQVRAKDRRDNVDPSPAVWSFVVELGIECFFPAAPPIITNQDAFTLAWDCRDETPDKVDFRYSVRLNDGEWTPPQPAAQHTFTSLPEGQHTVAVRAEDAIGNRSARDLTHTFTVDLTPPRTAPIDRLVLNPQYEPVIQLSAVDNFTTSTRIRYRYSLDNVNWQPIADREFLVMTGRPVRFWSPGYKVYVSSMDEAGNVDPDPAVVDFTFLGRNPIAAYAFLGGAGLFVLCVLGLFLARLRPRRPSPVLAETDMFGEARPAEEDSGGYSSASGDDLFGEPPSEEKKPSDDLFA